MTKDLSRQRRWQIKQVKNGRCSRCGKPREHYRIFCDQCQSKFRKGRGTSDARHK